MSDENTPYVQPGEKVKVHDPMYRDRLGMVIGGPSVRGEYLVRLNSGPRVWFRPDELELPVQKDH